MLLKTLCGLLLSMLLFSSCLTDDAPNPPTATSTTAAPILQNPDTQTVTLKTDVIARKVKRAIKPTDITVKEALKDMRFDPQAVKLFVQLANKTGGYSYFAKNSAMVAQTIVSVFDKHTVEQTDIMLLIDKTGSMDDDIINVQNSIDKIVGRLKKFKNIQLGWAAYGDKYADSTNWYEHHNLTADLDNSLAAIKGLNVSGGGDIPESVNDAIYRTIDETNWRPGARKMLLVIGDAPSLEPPYSEKTLNDIVKKCLSSAVHVNLYPIVIRLDDAAIADEDYIAATDTAAHTTTATTKRVEGSASIITNVYPNPTTNFCTVNFSAEGEYKIEVKTLLGKGMLLAQTNAKTYNIDLTSAPAGVYIITATNTATLQTDIRQVIKK